MLGKFIAAMILTIKFFYLMSRAGIATIFLILQQKWGKANDQLQDGYIAMEFPTLNDNGLVLMASLISLTPGTTTISVESSTQRMVLHILDTRTIDTTIKEIREQFEPYVTILFAKSKEAQK